MLNQIFGQFQWKADKSIDTQVCYLKRCQHFRNLVLVIFAGMYISKILIYFSKFRILFKEITHK